MGESRRLVTIMMMATFAATLVSIAYATAGTATYYTPPYVPSSCNGYRNDGVMIAAASNVLWDNRKACNKKYRVRCTGGTNQGVAQPCRSGSIVVTIVDYCPPGCRGTIDLSQEAFAKIADPNAGVVKIDYTPA